MYHYIYPPLWDTLKHLLNETILNKSFSLDDCSVEKISICSGLYLAVWLCPVTFL